jgi:hypothetical protein
MCSYPGRAKTKVLEIGEASGPELKTTSAGPITKVVPLNGTYAAHPKGTTTSTEAGTLDSDFL